MSATRSGRDLDGPPHHGGCAPGSISTPGTQSSHAERFGTVIFDISQDLAHAMVGAIVVLVDRCSKGFGSRSPVHDSMRWHGASSTPS